ncbi:MAG TPA: hypothetical protein PKI55_12825 [Chitinophagaceae bacterium]|nr:hypothetical protein [Chitinophagaceae bacterium]
MKGRITIEVDFDNNNEPVIQAIVSKNSDDVRDRLLSFFFERLSLSSLLSAKCLSGITQDPGFSTWKIQIIKEEEVLDKFEEYHRVLLRVNGETEDEILRQEVVEKYLKEFLKDAKDPLLTQLAGSIRGFYQYLNEKGFILPKWRHLNYISHLRP